MVGYFSEHQKDPALHCVIVCPPFSVYSGQVEERPQSHFLAFLSCFDIPPC
uniref:Uncharacterized protein n=1 Tax=Arundo donax TaxID=35708 RepID=A0A0A9GMR3_ARUDO